MKPEDCRIFVNIPHLCPQDAPQHNLFSCPVVIIRSFCRELVSVGPVGLHGQSFQHRGQLTADQYWEK